MRCGWVNRIKRGQLIDSSDSDLFNFLHIRIQLYISIGGPGSNFLLQCADHMIQPSNLNVEPDLTTMHEYVTVQNGSRIQVIVQ